ncbi:MAG: outer membrane protein assembly factor BamD [Phycisphaeraceae bacterium]|nr:MAG: outer membrane protein assembly factor BamD [Phycisphaeraceae bacterium]
MNPPGPTTLRRPPHARHAVLTALAVLALAGQASHAQTRTMTLSPDGVWEQDRPPAAGSPEEGLAVARGHLARNQPERALVLLDEWLERYRPDEHPLIPAALLARGDAKTASGDEFEALYDYEDVIKNYPASEEFSLAVEREVEIATRYINGLRRKFIFGLRTTDATDIGEELLVRAQERMPGSQLAERACVELADHYYRIRDLPMAADAYEVLLKNFPLSEYAQRAMQRRVFATIAQFKGPGYDARPLREAQQLIGQFASRYPLAAEQAGMTDALAARLDESAAAHLLSIAEWYLVRDDPVAARFQLRRLIVSHPATVASRRALEIAAEKGWAMPSVVTERAPAPDAPTPGDARP